MPTTTLGRELVRRKLPEKYRDWADRVLDKKTLTDLSTRMALDDPDGYVKVLNDLDDIAERVVSVHGRDAALSYTDAVPDKSVMKLNSQLRALVDKVLDDDSLTESQKEERIKDIGYRYSQRVQDAVFADQDRRRTPLASQINSGSRGNKTQLMQLMFGNMMMKDALNRDIPYLMMDPYIFGASPMGYWVSASSGRKGFYDVQAATGQAGYLGKQVTAVTHDTTIEKDDCGTTDTGVPFPADSTQNIGAVLLRPFHSHPAGSVVDAAMVAEADEGEEMILRSPLTCKCRHGVCAKCNGLGENGKFPGVGEYVSLNAARTFVEKVTQAGISCLHPDTLVRMGDNSVKRIGDIRPGDTVMGVDKNLKTAPAKVLEVFDNGIQSMHEVYADHIGERLVCTSMHRLYGIPVEGNEGMHSAGTLDKAAVIYDGGKVGYASLTMGLYAEDFPAMDIEVDNDTHWYLLANGMVTHNSKHTGGVGGKKVVDPDGPDQPTGFRSMERMFMVPQNFPGGAVLAPMSGTVSSIRPAPQGGSYITVGTKTVYCSPDRTVTVKPGDSVEDGDALTNGVPNPDEVVSYKGLGQGRRFYVGKLGEVFKKAGFGVDRRNLESFTRAMINKVRVTDPDGYGTHLPGDIIDYSEAAADWKPRDNAADYAPSKAQGMYLDAPAMHYSIGTRITPSVAKDLESHGFNKVTACPDAPPFKAEFMRPAEALQNDRNWLPRMAGERLRDSLFDAARRGITDPYDSPSYVDRIVAAPFKQEQ